MKKPMPKRAKVAGDALPPWIAENDRDKELMHKWVNRQLDQKLDARIRDIDGQATAFIDEEMTDDRVKDRQDHLMERIRQVDGEALAEWMLGDPNRRPPPLKGQGRKYSPPRKRDLVQFAIDDATAIRALWKQHYGRSNRPKSQLSAEEIAARRWLDNREDDGNPVREDDKEERLEDFLGKIHARKHGSGPSGETKERAAKRSKSRPKK